MLLATVLFAAILAINRVFVAEREQGGFDAIRLAPVDATSLYLAKVCVLVVYLVALELIAVPVFAIFFLDDAAGGSRRSPACCCSPTSGLAAIGALVSSIAVNSRARDLIAPLLLLPLLVPGDDRAPPARPSRCCSQTARHTRASASGWRCSLSTMWCSASSAMRSTTSCSRTEPRGARYG